MSEILPLLVFTTFGGAAAGAYVVAALGLPFASGRSGDSQQAGRTVPSWVFPLVCIILLGIGLLGTLLHLGQPLRFINGMSNPSSMISQESYWAIAFGVLMVIDLAVAKLRGTSNAVVRVLAAVAACGLMVVTGLAYHACLFLPAWSGAITVPLFIVGDLALGVGVTMLFAKREEIVRMLHIGNIAVSLAWLATAVSYAIHLAGIGDSVTMVAVGIVLDPVVSAAVSVMAVRGKLSGRVAEYVVVACAAVGVILVRGAFFAAGVL